MGFFDEPIRKQAAGVRDGILQLLRNHHPGQGTPADLLDLTERYLRLNPHDAEVKSALDALRTPARNS